MELEVTLDSGQERGGKLVGEGRKGVWGWVGRSGVIVTETPGSSTSTKNLVKLYM